MAVPSVQRKCESIDLTHSVRLIIDYLIIISFSGITMEGFLIIYHKEKGLTSQWLHSVGTSISVQNQINTHS